MIGIPQINESIVRPLLIFSREQIALYAQQNHLEWKEDSSNQSDKYLRNNIRHNIVPLLEGLHTNFLESFHQTSLNLQQTRVLVQDALQKAYQDVVSNVNDRVLRFDLQLLMQLKPYTLYLHYWLKDFGFTAWEDIYNLAEPQTGKKIGSPTHTLLKNREELLLYPNDSAILEYIALEIDTIPYSNESIPIRIEFCNTSYPTISSANCIFVDYDKIKMPLVLRKWKEGDVFYPLGMDRIPFTPEHQMQVSAAIASGRFEFGLRAVHVGSTITATGTKAEDGSRVLDAWTVSDADATVRLAGWAEVFASVQNLLGDHYAVGDLPAGWRDCPAPYRVDFGCGSERSAVRIVAPDHCDRSMAKGVRTLDLRPHKNSSHGHHRKEIR